MFCRLVTRRSHAFQNYTQKLGSNIEIQKMGQPRYEDYNVLNTVILMSSMLGCYNAIHIHNLRHNSIYMYMYIHMPM